MSNLCDGVKPWLDNHGFKVVNKPIVPIVCESEDIGNKYDDGKLDWTLLPWKSVEQVVKVLAFGANKYAPNAWKQVPDARRRYMAATYRHLTAVSQGEWLDSESHIPHLAHAACNILFLIWFGEDK